MLSVEFFFCYPHPLYPLFLRRTTHLLEVARVGSTGVSERHRHGTGESVSRLPSVAISVPLIGFAVGNRLRYDMVRYR